MLYLHKYIIIYLYMILFAMSCHTWYFLDITCPLLIAPSMGSLSYMYNDGVNSNKNLIRTNVSVICDKGYTPNSNSTRECVRDGINLTASWTREPFVCSSKPLLFNYITLHYKYCYSCFLWSPSSHCKWVSTTKQYWVDIWRDGYLQLQQRV